MQSKKVLIFFVMVTAAIALFTYTSVRAADYPVLQGFEIRAADPFYVTTYFPEPNTTNVTFNYLVNKSGSELLSFIDILIPGNINVGTCTNLLGEKWNCSNIKTYFGGTEVNNVTYDLKEGTPLSKFGAGISDKRALRVIIGKKFSGSKTFSINFKNQTSASLPKSGYAYLQVTKPLNKYDSAKYLGPDEVVMVAAFEDFGQAVYEEVPIGDGSVRFIIDNIQKKVYDSRFPTEPLVGKLITSMEIKDVYNFTTYQPVKNITNKALLDGGPGSCYPYCYNGRYYTICWP